MSINKEIKNISINRMPSQNERKINEESGKTFVNFLYVFSNLLLKAVLGRNAFQSFFDSR